MITEGSCANITEKLEKLIKSNYRIAQFKRDSPGAPKSVILFQKTDKFRFFLYNRLRKCVYQKNAF